jgi:alkylation response protein AidB-like acyl-CoA dehydrogenase
MKLHLTADQTAFRDQLRRYFETVPDDLRSAVQENRPLTREQTIRGMQFLNAEGLAVPHWPAEWGGRTWSGIENHIWHEELHRACVPRPFVLNANLVGPVIARFGTDEQKQRFLPASANLDIWWCQGFSEPGSGSDLASVRTTALRSDDTYIVNGQKTWTTTADLADWIFLLVRTDPGAKKQKGISFLLADMKSPGITVRPIELIDGSHEVCEVFFENVEVPAENLIGDENRGWDYAKSLLGAERANTSPVGYTKRRLADAKRAAADTIVNGRRLIDRPAYRDRLADLENELVALELTLIRIETTAGGNDQPSAASILKLRATELDQALTALEVDMAGFGVFASTSDPATQRWAQAAAPTYLNTRKASIYGGSNEVQRQIIARSILGL